LAGRMDDDDDNVRLLNSFILFPNPQKISNVGTTMATKGNNKTLQKERQNMWNSLKDYGSFQREKLEKEIQSKMVCRACIEHVLGCQGEQKVSVDISNFCLNVLPTNSAFTSLLTVECKRGLHLYIVKPP